MKIQLMLPCSYAYDSKLFRRRKLTTTLYSAEAKSLATLQRLNDSRNLAGIDGIQRIHVGPSVDLLIRMDDDVDVGCGESSKPVKNKETDTKTLTEGGIKGPKTAQDMLAYLKHVTYDQTTTRKLKVMVLITAGNQLALLSHTYYSLKGLTLQLLRMDAPAGYM